jgi:hypothetical protein
MVQQQQESAYPRQVTKPRRRDILFHLPRTFRLVGALVKDGRVSAVRKVGFFLCLALLVAILAFPDTLDELGLSIVLPLIGTILGIPLDAGFDWLAFALVSVSLLRLFPSEIVNEHFTRIFQPEVAKRE